MNSNDWSSGSHYYGGWIAYILLLLPTVVFNVITFLLITYSPRLNQSTTALLVRYLAVEDASFAFLCLIQCIINVTQGYVQGAHAACEFQAAYLAFFALSTGYTLCCIAYNNEQRIASKAGLSERKVLYAHLLGWSAAAATAVVSCTALAPARLVPSGLYCVPALDHVGPMMVMLGAGTFIICPFLLHRYFLMWREIVRHNAATLSAWEQLRLTARMQQVKVAKRMLIIISVYFGCYLPEIILSVWEIKNGEASASAHILTGCLVHLNSLLNPVLYVYCNSNMRQALWETFHKTSRNRVFPMSPMNSPPRSLHVHQRGPQLQMENNQSLQPDVVTTTEVTAGTQGSNDSPAWSTTVSNSPTTPHTILQLPPLRTLKRPLHSIVAVEEKSALSILSVEPLKLPAGHPLPGRAEY